MQTTSRSILVVAMLAAFGSTAAADVVTSFNISIDTSSLNGTIGGIYMSFTPGFDSDPASVAISGFDPAAGLPGGPALTHGGVTGTLDTADLVFTNYLYQLNDYGELVTFTNTLTLQVTFDLPDTLNGGSGSEFDLGLTLGDLSTPVLTTDPSGNIIAIPYDLNGAFSPASTSPSATVTPAGAAPTPEPGTFFLLPLIGIGFFLRAIKRRPVSL